VTRYFCPRDSVKPRPLTDDEAYAIRGNPDVFDTWSRARGAAQAHAERMVAEARSQLDRARSLRDVANSLPGEAPVAQEVACQN